MGQQLLLVPAVGAVGIIGDEALLGQDVQASKQSCGFVKVEVVDVDAALCSALPLIRPQTSEQSRCIIARDSIRRSQLKAMIIDKSRQVDQREGAT